MKYVLITYPLVRIKPAAIYATENGILSQDARLVLRFENATIDEAKAVCEALNKSVVTKDDF